MFHLDLGEGLFKVKFVFRNRVMIIIIATSAMFWAVIAAYLHSRISLFARTWLSDFSFFKYRNIYNIRRKLKFPDIIYRAEFPVSILK